jgi:hypothetical protein
MFASGSKLQLIVLLIVHSYQRLYQHRVPDTLSPAGMVSRSHKVNGLNFEVKKNTLYQFDDLSFISKFLASRVGTPIFQVAYKSTNQKAAANSFQVLF